MLTDNDDWRDKPADCDADRCDSDRYFIAWLRTATLRQMILCLSRQAIRELPWKRVAIARELRRRQE